MVLLYSRFLCNFQVKSLKKFSFTFSTDGNLIHEIL